MFQLRSLLRDHNAQDRVLTHVSTVNEENCPSWMILEAQQTCCYSCGGPVPCLSTRSHPIQLVACAMRHNFDDRHTCTCMLMVMSSCPPFMVAIVQPRRLLLLRSGTYATANAALSLDVAYLCMTRQWKLSASASASCLQCFPKSQTQYMRSPYPQLASLASSLGRPLYDQYLAP